jgi:hypothetical protein
MSEGAKNIHLRPPPSTETIRAIASDTLQAGGWVEPPPEPKIGDKMPDGTIFAGISPDTNKPMYATPADALTMTFNEAKEYAAKLDAHGHQDWRVPTKAELNVLFNNRAAIGGFDGNAPGSGGMYYSSSPNEVWSIWGQHFGSGDQQAYDKTYHSSVRAVR